MAGIQITTKTLLGLIIALMAILVVSIAAVTALTFLADNPDAFKPNPTPAPTQTPLPAVVPTEVPTAAPTHQSAGFEDDTLGLSNILNVPGGDLFDAAGNNGSIGGLYEYEQYWQSTGVKWTSDKKAFGLTELYLSVDPANAPLYTSSQETTFTLNVPWRIVWNVTGADGMTPYSDASLALFKYDSGGIPHLMKTFGWNGDYSAETKKVEGFFEPGTYGLGVFLRNAGVDIDIQQSTRLITVAGMEAA